LTKGWSIHHGVAKFAANALTILCICEEAELAVREFAIQELVAGIAQWLQSTDEPEELDEVRAATHAMLCPASQCPTFHQPARGWSRAGLKSSFTLWHVLSRPLKWHARVGVSKRLPVGRPTIARIATSGVQ
jgi:hypothetical protein